MSCVTPTVYDSAIQRRLTTGDVLALGEIIGTLTTAGAGNLTANLLTAFSIISRTGPAGAYNDTTDSAANIIAVLTVNQQTPQPGTTLRLRILNTVAFIGTMVAGTGVTLAGVTANAASSFRDYLITLTNTTVSSIAVGNTVNGSAVLTGFTERMTRMVSPGMAISGAGIPANATVLSVQPNVGVTISANATATAGLVALTFNPTVLITGIGGGSL